MRGASIAALAATVAVVAACGGSDSSDTQSDAIAQTWSAYIEAVKSGDGELACEQLTPTFRRQAAQLVTPRERKRLKGASCATAIEQGTLRAALQQFEPNLERVQVNGRRASGFQPGQGPLGPEKILFRRLGGDWKIFATIYQKGGPKFGA